MELKRSFSMREGLALLGALAVVLFVAWLSYINWMAFETRADRARTTREIVIDAGRLFSALKDAEAGQRGFLLTGEESYLEPYNQALTEIPVLLKLLDNLAAKQPDDAEHIAKLKPLINEKLAELALAIRMRQSIGPEGALAIVQTGRGRIVMETIREIYSEMETAAAGRLTEYSNLARKSANELGTVATAGSLSLFALLVVAAITIQRDAARRRQLIQATEESEQHMKEARDLLQTTLRSIGDGVIATDADGKVTFLNDVAQLLTGWRQEDAAGRAIEEIFAISDEETGEKVENPAARALREGRVVGLANHGTLTSNTGVQIPIQDSAAPIRTDQGGVVGAVLVFRDVTEQRSAEKEFKQRAERNRKLLNANPIGVVYTDLQGGMHDANEALLSMLGYTREELSAGALNWKALTPPEHEQLDEQAIAEAKEHGVCKPFEKEYIRKDGSRVPVYIGFALLGEAPDDAVAFVLDLTDRKQSEEKLTRQVMRLVDSNIIGIMVANERQVLEANDLFLGMLGYSREDLEAGKVDLGKATSEDSLEREATALQEMRERGYYTPYEKYYVRPDGTRIPVLIGAAVLTYEPELTWICFVADLKAQKMVEAELISANKRLLDSNEGLQSFAYVAAHDLKSPMRTISTMTAVLLQKYEEHLDPESRSMADYIESSVKQMDNLISDLLDYSQVAVAAQKPNENIDCAAVFHTTVMNLQSQIEEAGALVSAGPLPHVHADNQLFRVFQNLIENSLKYRSERSPEIHVSAVNCGQEWIFSFRDNGIGFDPAHADRIFGVFQRLHGIGKYQGSGIGLAICKKTIDRYGGRMWAESEPGVGSTFFFSVPSTEPGV